MKKARRTDSSGEMRAEYDAAVFRGGIRGKYAQRFRQGTNLVPLEPDIAAAFPTPAAVNGALRMLLEVARTTAEAAPKKSRK
jgi:hypothetical protein